MSWTTIIKGAAAIIQSPVGAMVEAEAVHVAQGIFSHHSSAPPVGDVAKANSLKEALLDFSINELHMVEHDAMNAIQAYFVKHLIAPTPQATP